MGTGFRHARLLLMPSGVGLAHLGRLLLIADALRKRGHAVAFAYGGRHGDLIEGAGVPCFAVAEVEVSDFAANVYALYTPVLVERALEEERAVIGAFRPDAVIADFRPTAAISSRTAGLPLVQIKNLCLTKQFDVAGLFLDRHRRPWRYWSARLLARAIQGRQRRNRARVLAEAAHRRGLAPRDLYDFFQGDLNLIADLPEFAGPCELPQSTRFVGPLVWEGPSRELPADLLERAGEGGVIYATTGNTGRPEVLDVVAETLGKRGDLRVILTTGAYGSPERYASYAGVRAWRFLPGSAAMRRADVAIHCGGSGTTYQSLGSGLPSVVIPTNNEQRINARLVAKHRVGVALDVASLSAERLRAAVGRVLGESSYRERTQSFQAVLAGWDGPALAVEAIEEFLGLAVQDGAPQPRQHHGATDT